MTRKRIAIALIAVSILAAAGFGVWRARRTTAPEVTVETIATRDLTAVVSASGTIQPKRSVNVSANTMGRVTRLAVEEGDRVRSGQFLLQIDPKPAETAVQRSVAGLEAARSARQAANVAVESARVTLELARDSLARQRELWAEQLTTREALERAENEVKLRESELRARETEVATQEQRIRQEVAGLESARYDLSKVTIDAPIDGIVTRRTIEEGETVLVGTMNNPGTVLLTIADMSVIEAEVEVDETDIPSIELGQPATVSIDALPDRPVAGHVTEIGNSPIQDAASQAGAVRQATNFKVAVTIEDHLPEVRPGFTCTADITTATRSQAVAVPIQAATVREVVLDAAGEIVPEPEGDERPGAGTPRELEPGQRRQEVEGVFVWRDGRAHFRRITTGIAAERYFEVVSGLEPGELVVTGPFEVVRTLENGDEVRMDGR